MGLRTGCSSWTSEAWRGRFYPVGIADADRLRYYARRFDTVEVDASYYRDPGPGRARRWASVTPDGFTFAMKMPRELLDPGHPAGPEALGRFLTTARALGPKLGPILLQFPPSFSPRRHEAFLDALLGRLPSGARYAVELRHADWFTAPRLGKLKERLGELGIALAWSYLTFLDVPAVLTADFVYLRFIGDHTTVPASVHGEIRIDRTEAVRRWAAPAREADRGGRDVFAYFNNHFAGFAPESVNLFRREMGLPPIPIALPAWTTLSRPDAGGEDGPSPG
ncbi:MAG: DUF72 domain-containing protein [Thermoplasmata archaeon]